MPGSAHGQPAAVPLLKAFQGLPRWLRSQINQSFDLIEELVSHRFFQALGSADWSAYQLGPLLVSSALANLLELATPLYLNIVYTSIMPARSGASLLVLTVSVVVLILLGGWLKTVRLGLTGSDGARLEHRNRLEALDHFCHIPLGSYLAMSPAAHAERLSSINMLRDETTVQALTTAIDLAFSLLFVVALFLIGGSLGFVAIVAILVYLIRALAYSRDYEAIAKQRDRLELERLAFQGQLVASMEVIKANGLGRQYLVDHEQRQEELAWQRMQNAQFSGRYQAFGALTSQVALATMVTWGAFLVLTDQLLVGALAACLLLAGKVLTPWRAAMGLWNNYRRLSHARDEYEALMALPVESPGGPLRLELPSPSLPNPAPVRLDWPDGQVSLSLPAGEVVVLRDHQFGTQVRHLFRGLIQIEPLEGLQLQGRPIEAYSRDPLRQAVAYVDPSHRFFDGTILQNLTIFQTRRYQRRALFWSYLSGLDTKISAMPKGYDTPIGRAAGSSLSTDTLQLMHLVRALATTPQLLLLDLSGCSYGKEFIDGLQRILKRTRGRLTVWINGSGRVLDSLSDQQWLLPASELAAVSQEVTA